MIRRLQPFSMGSSSKIVAKGLLPSMAETFRTHSWSLLLNYTVPFSSMGNALLDETDGEDIGEGRPLKVKPISISNKNVHILPFFKDQNISSKGLLPSMAEMFRIHDWSLLLKHTVPFSLLENTSEFVDDDEKSGARPLKSIPVSEKDLHLASFLDKWPRYRNLEVVEMAMLLPSTIEMFETKDLSLLRKVSSLDSNLSIEDAIKSELVAICVVFLFTEVPPHVKEGVARTLIFISLGTSNLTKTYTDQVAIENLIVHILKSGNTEVQRQVCLALFVLSDRRSRRFGVTFGDGIQDQLLQLICNLSCNPDLAHPVVGVIACIVGKGGKGMREKIVKTELLDSWLVKLLSRKDDNFIMAHASWTVACIARERCDCELWAHLKEKLLPPVINGLCCETSNVRLLGPVVFAILKITEYGSSDQINDLVEMGSLNFLIDTCSNTRDEDLDVLETCLDAVDNILRAGEAKAKAKAKADKDREFELEDKVENVYAKVIDDYGAHELGWYFLLLMRTDLTYNDRLARKAEAIVQKYRPHLSLIMFRANWM